MAKTITLELRPEDAEPILRKAAEQAAKFGAYCDYIDRRTVNSPTGWSENFYDARKRWNIQFLSSKRIVEAFGVEYHPTSEAETLTVYHASRTTKHKDVNVAGIRMRQVLESVPDPKNDRPEYRREIHAEACRKAAERVVMNWRETLAETKAA